MITITEKKIRLLKERGMVKVGEILQAENGELAFVEGAAVRWLDADKRDEFMIGELNADSARLDWLSDKENHIGNVQLPTKCVENNIDSLRGAIDDAMDL